jgi:hypothetical protein
MTTSEYLSTDVETLASDIEKRRSEAPPTNRVIFGIKGLYGIAQRGMRMPLNEEEYIDSGQIVLMLDPETAPNTNIGIADFENLSLRVRYGVQGVFPGLHDLVMSGRHDPSLLSPLRATATDDCTIEPDLSGWHARGCLEFLPGSLWSGAKGG